MHREDAISNTDSINGAISRLEYRLNKEISDRGSAVTSLTGTTTYGPGTDGLSLEITQTNGAISSISGTIVATESLVLGIGNFVLPVNTLATSTDSQSLIQAINSLDARTVSTESSISNINTEINNIKAVDYVRAFRIADAPTNTTSDYDTVNLAYSYTGTDFELDDTDNPFAVGWMWIDTANNDVYMFNGVTWSQLTL